MAGPNRKLPADCLLRLHRATPSSGRQWPPKRRKNSACRRASGRGTARPRCRVRTAGRSAARRLQQEYDCVPCRPQGSGMGSWPQEHRQVTQPLGAAHSCTVTRSEYRPWSAGSCKDVDQQSGKRIAVSYQVRHQNLGRLRAASFADRRVGCRVAPDGAVTMFEGLGDRRSTTKTSTATEVPWRR